MLLLLCESVCMCTCVFAHDICECQPESRGKIVWSVFSFALPVLGTELGHLACFMHFIRPQLFSYFKYEIVVRHCIDKQDVLSCYIGWAQIGRPWTCSECIKVVLNARMYIGLGGRTAQNACSFQAHWWFEYNLGENPQKASSATTEILVHVNR